MSNSESETPEPDSTLGIDDDLLPDDLRPGDDNPLAQPLSDEEAPDDLAELEMDGGKTPDEWDDEQLED
jgi:hypothetical protein